MLKNLDREPPPGGKLAADVAVIGGGIAGLMLANKLARLGVRVVVLESGGETLEGETSSLNEVVLTGQSYQGAEKGRFRCLGGTSVRWGGAMLPFLPCDMGPHTANWPVEWPVTLDQVSPEFPEIEKTFRLPGGPYEVEYPGVEGGDFILRGAKWPAFGMRNVAQVLRESVRGADLEIWVNATVVQFGMDDGGRLASVRATGQSGATLTVEARTFVVAAGAIESTRLLLLMDRQHDNRIFQPDGQLGAYFFDHLSAAAAIIQPASIAALNQAFGLGFVQSGMRDLRLEPSMAMRKASALPAAFAHVAFQTDEQSGFAALRDLYRGFQSKTWPSIATIAGVGRDATWLARAAWWRFARQRLLAPRDALCELKLVIEQFPSAGNTISLADDRLDKFGNPLARIDWRVNREDVDCFSALQSKLAAYWRGGAFARLGELSLVPMESLRESLNRNADIFHPGGTTRMGRDRASAVVDSEMRAFRIDNLHVVSTSSFPTGGGANPTFMLMAFALRAASRIAADLRKAGFSAPSAPDAD